MGIIAGQGFRVTRILFFPEQGTFSHKCMVPVHYIHSIKKFFTIPYRWRRSKCLAQGIPGFIGL
jgi:hypothetical protein